MTHTIFVDTPGIEWVDAYDYDKAWLAEAYELGHRAMGYGQSLLPPPAHRYEVLMGQLNRKGTDRD
jgi:hypothetical protein